ncbi:MAG: hypothetical protein ACI9Y1_000131, partial [Lentisphaeria bacterium]
MEGEAFNGYCREAGVYPHHIKQWKHDFVTGANSKSHVTSA